jgi:hypothetical protein
MENTNYEVTEVEVQEVAYDEAEPETGSGIGPLAVVLGLGAAAVGVGALVWKKTEAWREERTLKKAEKILAKREAAEGELVEVEPIDESEETAE